MTANLAAARRRLRIGAFMNIPVCILAVYIGCVVFSMGDGGVCLGVIIIMGAMLAMYGVAKVTSNERMVNAFYYIAPLLGVALGGSLTISIYFIEGLVYHDGYLELSAWLTPFLVVLTTIIAFLGVIIIVKALRQLAILEKEPSSPMKNSS